LYVLIRARSNWLTLLRPIVIYIILVLVIDTYSFVYCNMAKLINK
jgi:hypothetical protein